MSQSDRKYAPRRHASRSIADFISPGLLAALFDGVVEDDYLVRYHAAEIRNG